MLDIPAILTYAILQNDAINAAIDGMAAPGDSATLDDFMLEEANKTCILTSELTSTSSREMGNDETATDAQIQIEVISLSSKAYCRQTANLVRSLLLDDIEVTWDGAAVHLFDFEVMQHALYENDQWREILTITFKFWE
jgi:hypothetical protein